MSEIFISYSRNDLYFTESLVFELQKRFNLDVWFDIQRIRPGRRWKQEIEDKLRTCDALVLIVSQSSLTSPWTEAEWQHALDNNKPIYLVLREEANFQPTEYIDFDGTKREIRSDLLIENAKAIIDARRNFKANMTRLGNAITQDATHVDNIPSVNRFNIPTKSPLIVQFLGLLLCVLGLGFVYATVTTLYKLPTTFAAGVLVSTYMFYITYKFMKRDFVWWHILSVLLINFVVWSAVFPIFSLLCVGAILLTLVSKDIVRWMPRGEALRFQRRYLRSKSNTVSSHRDGVDFEIIRQFKLHFDKSEFSFAASIEARLKSKGLTSTNPVMPNKGKTQTTNASYLPNWYKEKENLSDKTWNIVLITNNTDPNIFDEVTPNEETVVILGSQLSNIHEFQQFLDFQWVDYRSRDRAIIDTFASSLANGKINDVANNYSSQITPQSFNTFIVPKQVTWYILLLYYSTTFTVVGIIRRLVLFPNIVDSNTQFILKNYISPILYVVFTVWLSIWIIKREITAHSGCLSMIILWMWRGALSFGGLAVFLDNLSPPSTGSARYFFTYLVLFFVVYGWLPSKTKASFFRRILNLGSTYRLFIQQYAVFALMSVIILSTLGIPTPYTTPAAEDIAYDTVILQDKLSFSVPNHLLSLPIKTDEQIDFLDSVTYGNAPLYEVTQNTAFESWGSIANTIHIGGKSFVQLLEQFEESILVNIRSPYQNEWVILFLPSLVEDNNQTLTAFFSYNSDSFTKNVVRNFQNNPSSDIYFSESRESGEATIYDWRTNTKLDTREFWILLVDAPETEDDYLVLTFVHFDKLEDDNLVENIINSVEYLQ